MDTAIVLLNPKYPHNVGGVLRACAAFGVDELWWTGTRVTLPNKTVNRKARLPREERMRGYRQDVNFGNNDEALRRLIYRGLTPVAVEVRNEFESLVHFEHPENAVYVFGPEDGSIAKGTMHACHRFVYIPTRYCLNLSAAANVILYDRRMKRLLTGLDDPTSLNELLAPDPALVGVDEPLLKGFEGA